MSWFDLSKPYRDEFAIWWCGDEANTLQKSIAQSYNIKHRKPIY